MMSAKRIANHSPRPSNTPLLADKAGQPTDEGKLQNFYKKKKVEFLSRMSKLQNLPLPKQEWYKQEATQPSIRLKMKPNAESDEKRLLNPGRVTHVSLHKNFNLAAVAGHGSYGIVVAARLDDCSTKSQDAECYMAIKSMSKKHMNPRQIHALSERRMLTVLEHPFVVRAVDFFQNEAYIFAVTEYITGGDLFSYIRKQKGLNYASAQFISAQVLLAFEYLHRLRCVYRDMKPENVLVNRDGYIKLCDLGFTKHITSDITNQSFTFCGTPVYMSPEQVMSGLKTFGYGQSADCWALGVLIYEMISNRVPWKFPAPPAYKEKLNRKMRETLKDVKHNDYTMFYDFITTEKADFKYISRKDGTSPVGLTDLLNGLFEVDVTKRLGCMKNGATDIRVREYYKNIDFQALLEKKIQPPPGSPKPGTKPIATDQMEEAVAVSIKMEETRERTESDAIAFKGWETW